MPEHQITSKEIADRLWLTGNSDEFRLDVFNYKHILDEVIVNGIRMSRITTFLNGEYLGYRLLDNPKRRLVKHD